MPVPGCVDTEAARGAVGVAGGMETGLCGNFVKLTCQNGATLFDNVKLI
jgi:hypothetical protein